MTMEEASENYQIPMELLEEYRKWDLCGAVKEVMGVWQCDDRDLERLSLIMTLHDAGFSSDEIRSYMRLVLSEAETGKERLAILNKKRDLTLDEIHFKEKQLGRLDDLRYSIRKELEKAKMHSKNQEEHL